MLQNDAEASESSDDSDDDAETPSAQRNRDGTLASGTPAELRLARELAKDPWGRFGGRGGKLARIRKQEAAAVAAMQGELPESAYGVRWNGGQKRADTV